MKVKLRYWRKKRALTLRDITAKTGISSQTLVRIEQGHEPRPTTLHKLAEVLGITLDELFEVDEAEVEKEAEKSKKEDRPAA